MSDDIKVTLIIFAISAVFGAVKLAKVWIEGLVKASIESENNLKNLAKLMNRQVIFNSANSIVYDSGAMEYINSINVNHTNAPDGVPTTIEIDFKRHLSTPPLLTSLDIFMFLQTQERGVGHKWIYRLSPQMVNSDNGVFRFKIEILL